MLWEKDDLNTLRSFATQPGHIHRKLPDGTDVEIEQWTLRFPPAEPDRLPLNALRSTYTNKPLVAPLGEPLFGELAILKCLERDGWTSVWVDTYHGSRLFWNGMPHRSQPAELTGAAEARCEELISENGKRGGFFDVFAWRDEDFLFVEYKGPGDRPNRNESSWIAAALRLGVKPTQLLYAETASLRGN